MFRKALCLILSFCVFLATIPTPVYAGGWISDVDELDSRISEINPLMDVIGYQPVAPRRDEMAFYAVTDQLGRLYEIDVNLTRATALVRSTTQQYPAVPVPADELTVLRDLALLAAVSPEQRIQCGLPCVAIVVAAVGVVVAGVGLYLDHRGREDACRSQYMRDSAAYTNRVVQCSTTASGVSCPSGKPAVPVFVTTYGGDGCVGPTGFCNGSWCPN
jgi:hypothetical protein